MSAWTLFDRFAVSCYREDRPQLNVGVRQQQDFFSSEQVYFFVFLAHPKLQGLPAYLEVPGTDGHGPDAEQVKKLKALYARAKKRESARKRGKKARRQAARGTRG